MTVNLEEFLARSRLERETMQQWFERGWIIPLQTDVPSDLSDMDAARATFIRELKMDFGVNDEGVEIVLHLIDQLHGVRRVLYGLSVELHARDLAPGHTRREP